MQSADMVGIKVCQQHKVEIRRFYAARGELLGNALAGGDRRMEIGCQRLSNQRGGSFGVEYTRGGKGTADAGIDQNKSLWMLNEIAVAGELDPLGARCSSLTKRGCKPFSAAEKGLTRKRDRPAAS